MAKEYCIQPGDDFHKLAQRWGGSCEDFLQVNPSVDPLKLQIGQIVILPEFKSMIDGQEQYADIQGNHGQEFVGNYLDEVELEVEGVRLRLRRVGEPEVPHEIHFILPRTEIHKVQPLGETGPTDVQIMLSNLDVVLSPRLVSAKGDSAEQAKQVTAQYGQEAQPPTQAAQNSLPLMENSNQTLTFPFK